MTRRRLRVISNKLDSRVYGGPVQARESWTPLIEELLTPKLIDKSHRLLLVLLALMLQQMVIPMSAFAADYSMDQLRVYAHSRLINFNEFMCFDSIIIAESHYNYLASNGSHKGIGQMKSKYYQSKDPYTQIDLTIKYIHTRYKTMCSANAFHAKHGYY